MAGLCDACGNTLCICKEVIADLESRLAAERTRADEAIRSSTEHHKMFEVCLERARRAERLAAERAGMVEQAISCLRMGRYTQMADELRTGLKATEAPARPDLERGVDDVSVGVVRPAAHKPVTATSDKRGRNVVGQYCIACEVPWPCPTALATASPRGEQEKTG